MILLHPGVDPATSTADTDAEDLIKEARRLRRRRWIIRSSIVALVAGVGAAGYIVASGPPPAPHRTTPANSSSAPTSSASSAHAFTPTRSPDLIQPTTLATLPNGSLLILDSSRDQILELKPDGDLSVFAGNGHLGFAGDGGPARNAELDFTYFSSAGMAVAPGGTVDVLDDGNCRIRAIRPNGVVRTIVRVRLIKVYPNGTACPLTGVAVSSSGSVYVTTNSEMERLSATGHLVRAAGKQGPVADEPTHLTPRALSSRRIPLSSTAPVISTSRASRRGTSTS